MSYFRLCRRFTVSFLGLPLSSRLYSAGSSSAKIMDTTKILEVGFSKVKPKYFLDYVQALPPGLALYRKHGFKPLGVYFSEAGPDTNMVFFVGWESMDTRSEVKEAIMKDPEFVEFLASTGKYIYGLDHYIGFSAPPFQFKPFDEDGKLFMRTYSIKTSPPCAIEKFAEMVQKSFCREPLVVFHPITQQGLLICVWSVPGNKVDDLVERIGTAYKDKEKIDDFCAHLSEVESRVLKPLKNIGLLSADTKL